MNNSDLQHIKNKTKSFAGQFWLFMFWPFLSLVFSFINYRQVNSKNIIWLFTIFLGATFYFNEANDASRYVADLQSSSILNFSEFVEQRLFENGNFRIDFLQPLINFFVSRFTTDGHVLFMVYGAIFGYFYSRNIAYLLERFETKIKPESLAFLVIFVCNMSFHTMNGFRFNTAVHIFMYGLIHYIVYPKKLKGIFFIVFSMFLHDTFIISIFFFFLFVFLTKIPSVIHFVFYTYLLSFILSNLDFQIAREFIENYGIVRQERAQYLSEEYAESVNQSTQEMNFYVKYKYTLSRGLLISSFIWLYFTRLNLILKNKEIYSFFLFAMLLSIFTNLTESIPSMLRFYSIVYMCFAAMLYLFFSSYHFVRRPEWYKMIAFVVAYIFSIHTMWDGFTAWSLGTILGNPLTFWFFHFDKSVNELIKSFIF